MYEYTRVGGFRLQPAVALLARRFADSVSAGHPPLTFLRFAGKVSQSSTLVRGTGGRARERVTAETGDWGGWRRRGTDRRWRVV